MNWYAYKLLADSYAADRRHDVEAHRQARDGSRGQREARRPHWWPGRPR